MAEKNKNKFVLNNNHYLCGPLALVAFILVDIIGGFNFPGYIWSGQVIGDLNAVNAYSFIFAMIFAVIFLILTVFSVYCVFKFYKGLNFNKLIKRGISLFVVAAIIFALGFTAFVQTEYGTYDKIKEYAQIVTTEETVEPEIAAEDEEASEEVSEAVAETKTVIDEEATAQNLEDLSQVLIDNPTVIAGLAANVIANLLAVIALIFILIGGFKKKGKILFSAVSIFCLVLIVYSCVSVSVMAPDLLGLNSRFSNYAIVLFLAFLSSYVYVTNIEE